MTAVLDDESVSLTDQPHRRCLSTLLEPLSISLYRRHAETTSATFADSNLVERNGDRHREPLVFAHGPSISLLLMRRTTGAV
jgi:hypothetical protein